MAIITLLTFVSVFAVTLAVAVTCSARARVKAIDEAEFSSLVSQEAGYF